ncbi:MAG: glycosyltransferase [Bacteroidales bacterium]|nr:glycosyltransferase [Bacteroidales bacterium]
MSSGEKKTGKPVLVQLNSYSGSGSIGRIAEQIGLRAQEAGWDCHMVSGVRYYRPGHLKEIRFDTLLEERLHALRSMLFDAQGRGSYFATKRLIRRIRKLHPTIIHLHNVHGYYLHIGLFFRYLKKSGIPVVWTLHDCWSMTGHCVHFDAADCLRWQTECGGCPLRNTYPKSLFWDRSRANFRWKKRLFTALPNVHIVAVSQWLASVARQSFLQTFPIQVLHNGIDLNRFRPTSSDLRRRLGLEGAFVVLGVSSVWYASKGLAEFVRLSGHSEIRVVLVGMTEAQRAGLPEHLVSVGRTHSQEELAAYYTMADVFVNPTYNDSFPTVNMEALACGTPVVTYRTGGSPESVEEGTGIVVDRGDYEALEAAVLSFRKQAKPVEACLRAASAKFDMQVCADGYVKLYETLR